jgi:hypothetical protein
MDVFGQFSREAHPNRDSEYEPSVPINENGPRSFGVGTVQDALDKFGIAIRGTRYALHPTTDVKTNELSLCRGRGPAGDTGPGRRTIGVLGRTPLGGGGGAPSRRNDRTMTIGRQGPVGLFVKDR